MKNIARVLSITLCVILIFSSLITVLASDTTKTDLSVANKDVKVYANASIDQDFADDRVLVVMDNTVGALNKSHDKSFFKSDKIKNVIDLTASNNYSTKDTADNMVPIMPGLIIQR